MADKIDKERFSMREVISQKYDSGGSSKTEVTNKKVRKVNKKGKSKYITKVVDGVKYMILRG